MPSDGLENRGKSENNTLFYWIPPEPSRPAKGRTTDFGENDGAEPDSFTASPLLLAAYGAPRRHTRMTARSRTPSRRPRFFWRLTAPRAVILELARESRGTSSIAFIISTSKAQATDPPLMGSGNIKVVAFVPLDSRHPSHPADGWDDWGGENDGGLDSCLL